MKNHFSKNESTLFSTTGEQSAATGFRLRILLKRPEARFALLAILFLVAAWPFLSLLPPPGLNFWLCLLTLPFALYIKPGTRPGKRFAWLALAFFLLLALTGIKSLFMLGFAFSLFFLLESSTGRLNTLPFFLAFLFTPLENYATALIGIDLRIWLSNIAANILTQFGQDVEAQGNVFLLDGEEFSVDPACTGLKMILTGLILTLAWQAITEKQKGIYLPGWGKLGMLLFAVPLLILTNLVRILIIVWFRLEEGHPGHDAAGLFCLGLYFVLPLAIVSHLALKRWGKPIQGGAKALVFRIPTLKAQVLFGLLIVLAAYISLQRPGQQNRFGKAVLMAHIPEGYCQEQVEKEVLKLENGETLAYVKAPVAFYATDHLPAVCWKGAGFRLSHESLTQFGAHKVYVARLDRDGAAWYTAWWYDNGKDKTTSQVRWRWKTLIQGQGYHLINLTAPTREALYAEVSNWLKQDFFTKAGTF